MITDTRNTQHLAMGQPLADAECARMQENWLHWEENAKRCGADHSASWGDKWCMKLEIANLLTHLSSGGRWLDAGCANGFTTFHMLQRPPDEVFALDFSPVMIDEASKLQAERDPKRKITFRHGNILDIPASTESFDQAYTVRVLINLPSWDAQCRAIREIHRVLKPGGRYILSEAFAGSLEKLNALRKAADLPPLPAPTFNLYLQEQALQSFLPGLFKVIKVERFSSLYYVATRFLHELASLPGEHPNYNTPFNEFGADLEVGPRAGDFGIQKAYILSKI